MEFAPGRARGGIRSGCAHTGIGPRLLLGARLLLVGTIRDEPESELQEELDGLEQQLNDEYNRLEDDWDDDDDGMETDSDL